MEVVTKLSSRGQGSVQARSKRSRPRFRLSTGSFQTLPFRLSRRQEVCYDSLCKRVNFSSPLPCNHDYRQLWASLCTDCGSICG